MNIRAMVVAGMALALCACGDRDEPAAGSSGEPDAAGTQASAPARNGESAVAAVLESTGTAVAALSFEIEDRPVAGQPFVLKLLLSAAQPVPALHLAVESADLRITPANAEVTLAEASTPVSQELNVTAPEAGLFDLRVRLVAGEQGVEALYAIPVLVAAAK